MNHTNRFVIIDASPRSCAETTSAYLCGVAEKKLTAEGNDIQRIVVHKSIQADPQADFNTMREADALLFVFPLYIFCLPGMLIRFLQDYANFISRNPAKQSQCVYAIVNCGFPEPEINTEAVRVIASFSRHIGVEFGFGVCVGCGPMLTGPKDAPFMKPISSGLDDALTRMARGESGCEVMLSPRVPRWLYYFMGNFGWRYTRRKNGLKNKDIYRAPYAQ